MARKNYTAEQIIGMLREAEVRLSQGEKTGAICRGLGISEQSYYRWRREYGGLKVTQAARLKALEKEHLISEDDHKKKAEEVQKMTDETIKEVDAALKVKEAEIMQV